MIAVCFTEKPTRSTKEPGILQDITTRTSNLRFSTGLPGGFLTCSFSLMMAGPQARFWLDRGLFVGVLVAEGGGPVWEGRVASVVARPHGLDVEAEGYWSNLGDQSLMSWWNDNDMSNWQDPTPGAGAISNDISLTGAGAIDKFSVSKNGPLFNFSTSKGTLYSVGDKAITYYALPDLVGVTDDRPFGPLTIHSIQFTWDYNLPQPFKLKVWVANFKLGTWEEKLSIDMNVISPGVVTANIVDDGTVRPIVAIGIDCIYPYTETEETGTRRVVIKNLTIYADRDAVVERKTTAKKIIKDLLLGNSNVGVDAHASQVSSDTVFMEDTDLEIAPAIYENKTLQDIASSLLEFGLSQTLNLVDNPSVESDGLGWSGPSGNPIVGGAYGTDEYRVSVDNAADSGVTIKRRDGTRFPVTSGRYYTFSAHMKTDASKPLTYRINWFGIGADIFTLKKTSSSALKKTGDEHSLKEPGSTVTEAKIDVTSDLLFRRFSVSGVCPSNADQAQLEVLTPSAQGTFLMSVDAARFVEGQSSVYIDGDQPDGVWESTSHESKTVALVSAILGVFGRRRLHLRARDDMQVRWILPVKELGEDGLELERNIQQFYSRIWSRYSEAFTGEQKITNVQKSTLPEGLYSDERDSLLDLSDVTTTYANRVTKAQLEDSTTPRQRTEIKLSGKIANAVGASEPLWRVRAGDILMIPDLGIPSFLRNIGLGITDPLRVFLIRETEYDMTSGELTIVPDLAPVRLDTLVARLALLPSVKPAV